MLEDDELFCHECGTKQEIEDIENQVEEPVTSNKKYCVHCGEAIEADSMFCPFCGKPQEVEGEEEEPQPNTTEPEPQQEPEESEPKPEETEQPQAEELNNAAFTQSEQSEQPEKPQAKERPTNEWKEGKTSSKKWMWILLALLICGGLGVWYYMSDSFSFVSNNQMDEVTDSDSIAIVDELSDGDAKEFVESMYKDFFENKEFDTENISDLLKYLSPSIAEKLKIECPYDGGEGDSSYVICFFRDGSLSYERPDYGNKVVSRTIEPEKDDWFLVTNIWDVIERPVKVHLQVKSIGGAYKIVDIRGDEDDVSTDNSAEESTPPSMPLLSIANLRNTDLDDAIKAQEFNKKSISIRRGYVTDIWYKNCDIDNNGKIKTNNSNSCIVEVFDGMSASVRITVFEKNRYEQIKEEVVKYSVNKGNSYYFRWNDNETTEMSISMGVGDFIEGGYYIDIPLF